jgi:hypothetical protein
MRVLSLFVVPGVLALAISAAKADPSPNPEMGGAQTMPSGAEAQTPPPATYDPGTPGVAPSTTPPVAPSATDTSAAPATPSATDTPVPPATPSATDTAAAPATPPATMPEETNPALPPPGTPAAPTQTPTGATNLAIPPPPNGQVVEDAPVAPLPPIPGAPEGVYPGASVYSHVGVGLLVGGGFTDFTNSHLKNVTGDGGYWTARVVAGTREYVGMEAAYVGDARSISGLGLNNDSRLISNGFSGNLRINIPIARGASLVEPFGFVGVGWSHYTVTNNNVALSDVTSADNVLTLPYGGGLEFAYKGFMADARFTYTQTYYNNLTETVGGNLNNWGVGGQIGFEY